MLLSSLENARFFTVSTQIRMYVLQIYRLDLENWCLFISFHKITHNFSILNTSKSEKKYFSSFLFVRFKGKICLKCTIVRSERRKKIQWGFYYPIFMSHLPLHMYMNGIRHTFKSEIWTHKSVEILQFLFCFHAFVFFCHLLFWLSFLKITF